MFFPTPRRVSGLDSGRERGTGAKRAGRKGTAEVKVLGEYLSPYPTVLPLVTHGPLSLIPGELPPASSL